MDYAALTMLKNKLDGLRPLPSALVKNLEEWFRVELTFTSNALEGNTLSRRETALVIEKGLTVGGKTLVEHLEAKNHAETLDYIYDLAQKKNAFTSENEVLNIHALILKTIEDEYAGRYRHVPVRISGLAVVMPNPVKVPALMHEFFDWLKNPGKLHPVQLAGEAHYRLVTIHPFIDGNGRTARLLMNLLLLQRGYPPAIIRKSDRLAYLTALETAQLGGSRVGFDRLIAASVKRSLEMYIAAGSGKTPEDDQDLDAAKLLKIGELAEKAHISIATIRYWTKEGLLQAAEITASGYHLYHPLMITKCKEIIKMQAKRMTLAEIKRRSEEG